MLDRIYWEITNVCNLDCSFCHKTSREKRFVSKDEFFSLLPKIEGAAKYLFFHLMGEPLLHPSLPCFVTAARERGFLTAITTNGSLLAMRGEALLDARPYKISISLHAPEANAAFADASYFENCVRFAKEAAARGCVVALRLWNLGSDADNSAILDFLHKAFPSEWQKHRFASTLRLDARVFLEFGERFGWPDLSLPACAPNADRFCHGLRDQIGILADGTVVPCCLDADAHLALGNLMHESLADVLSSPRARAIYNGFSRRRAVEELCRKCPYASRFSK